MKLTTVAGALLALLVVTGSAAALPGAASAQADEHAADDHASDTADDYANDTSDGAAHADAPTDRRGPPADAGPPDERGPPAVLPEQVPAFVSQIHGLVGEKMAGSLDGAIGPAVSDVTPENETDEDGAGTATPSDP